MKLVKKESRDFEKRDAPKDIPKEVPPSRFAYLKSNETTPPTLLEKLQRIYPDSQPEYPDGTQQHLLRAALESSKRKSK